MGIYLPNVDMPQGDETLTVQICPDGSIWQKYRGTVPRAKAVPVPPHGRLIDADGEIGVNVTMMPGGKCRVDLIAPTIIPAEEGTT